MNIHTLKTWPDPFQAIWDREKMHEVRKTDRLFTVGDMLLLREYEPDSQSYTGREILCDVTYITKSGTWGIPAKLDLCVMSIRMRSRHQADGEVI